MSQAGETYMTGPAVRFGFEPDTAGYEPLGRAGIKAWLSLPLALWLALWLSINSGPWNLPEFGNGASASVNALRAAFPLIVLVLAFLSLLAGRRRARRSLVEYGFWIYGLVMLLAATGAANWFSQAYWGFAFLAALAVVEKGLRGPDPIAFARRLNWLSYVTTVLVLVALLFLARDVLLDASGSAYGSIVRFQEAHGYAISRSTGMARMAAVPAIIAIVFVFTRRSWQRALSLVALGASLSVLWIMQARGSIFALIGAMAFVMLFGPNKVKKIAFACAIAIVFVAVVGTRQDGFAEFWMHVTRGQGAEGFSTMSGRDVIFDNGVHRWLDSPLFGYGPQADRLFSEVGNAQNALLYALMCSGLVGASGFVLAMLAAWANLLRANLRYGDLSQEDREMLMITSGILVFSTLRSVPENQAAVFSIDLLLQYPAMTYLAMLVNRRRPGSALSVEAPSERGIDRARIAPGKFDRNDFMPRNRRP
ncbi:O-antigen ligase family protein [Jiella endophytica]|uniref:O-antigen ligase family protein n=1 Tax=Jiella endophytica TaxID=2558362 RepID=A0A4Y8RP32_9HYPH|nr:O-antigen ligase family protein [Jiella endophytica]TFF25106.1 O-antigen ligase family protein [Jiella endophytica]